MNKEEVRNTPVFIHVLVLQDLLVGTVMFPCCLQIHKYETVIQVKLAWKVFPEQLHAKIRPPSCSFEEMKNMHKIV
jgi:hypothetical protein